MVPAIVMGATRWENVQDAFLKFTGQVPYDDTETEPQRQGRYAEPGLLMCAADRYGPIQPKVWLANRDLGIGAHLDGQVIATKEPVECKANSDFANVEEWGEPGTAEVPLPVIFQTALQLILVKLTFPGVMKDIVPHQHRGRHL